MREIGKVEEKNIPECVNVIRRSFLTVAEEFGFTAEKDPKFTAFAISEEKLLHQMNAERRPIFACFSDGVIAGYYSLKAEENGEVELSNLCTAPEFRHEKIGEELLKHSFKTAKELGFSVMKICVVDANERVKRWYKNHGFSETGERDDFYPFPCIFMTIDL